VIGFKGPENIRPTTAAANITGSSAGFPLAALNQWLIRNKNAILWVVVAAVAVARLAQFWGLRYGNTDDICVDYHTLNQGWKSTAWSYAASQSRFYFLTQIPLYSLTMRLAGSASYDVMNLASFSLGATLPIYLFRKELGSACLQLYTLVFFATLPLLFSYMPPYSYPTYMFSPLLFCAGALFLFERWRHSQLVKARSLLLVSGCILLFLSLCSYEACTLVVLFILACYILLSQRDDPRVKLWKRLDFLAASAVVFLYVCVYFGWRSHFQPRYEGVLPAMNQSFAADMRVLATLSLTSSIYARFHFPQQLVYIDYGFTNQAVHPLHAAFPSYLISHLTMTEAIAGLLTAAVGFYLVMSIATRGTAFRIVVLGILGGTLLFLPNAMYPFVPKISNLVIPGRLFSYVGTAYSHIGFALVAVFLAAASFALPNRAFRIGFAVLFAVVLGWGSLASTDFNRVSSIYAREQAVKWEVLRDLSACSAFIPAHYLDNVVAPRLWNFSTGGLSWGDANQDQRYWDLFAGVRLGLRTHLMKEAGAGAAPLTVLDYSLNRDGGLEGVTLARRADGKHFQEAFMIGRDSEEYAPGISELGRGREYTTALPAIDCGKGISLTRFTGQDLNFRSARFHGLPGWSPE
jgi:hypothetical protein